MNHYPDELNALIELLQSLPGIGRRGASRIALAMLKWSPEKLSCLGGLIESLPRAISFCPDCGNISSHGTSCPICLAPGRDCSIICVVENFTQIIAIENSAFYRGLYHVLGGKLAPLSGNSIDEKNIEKLRLRLELPEVQELILAFSPDVEGQATAAYLENLFSGRSIKITRLAQGLPAGSDISYADSATITAALKGRR
ncbi:MAG: recombination protein RecR [Lentisphaerae bacterium]|nr:recombination protein RecR [Lentisphaerota bacterium]